MKSLSTSLALSSSVLLRKSASILSRRGFSTALAFLSLIARVKSFLSITTPSSDGPAFRDASFTSPALSPKIALRSFSSGDGSDSPLGVIFPIRISPGIIWAPILISPFSSRFLVASSLTFGISDVSSSRPRFVSRTSRRYSSIWTDVNISSSTTLSEITIASSKL